MSEQIENTQVETNNVKNDSTEAETNANSIPKSRLDEVIAQRNKMGDELNDVRSQLDKFKADQESARKQELEKQGEYKTIVDEQAKELEKYKADSQAWNTYKTDKRASIMETITNDDDKAIAEGLSLNKLEMFANRVTQTNAVGTPNQRPANSTKGVGDFGGYSSMEEWAMKDPKGCDEHLSNNVKGYQWGKVK
tara:strand:- start:423 stop:1004 length:582 start_codon:yes stop_codon:yes gene_type:complete